MPLTVRSFVVSPFAENTYVLSSGGEAALVDPGTATREERRQVEDYLEAEGLAVRHLLLTHGHIDHVFGAAHFARTLGGAAEHGGWQMHPADGPLLQNAPVQGERFGVRVDAPPPAAHDLADGDTLTVGDTTLRVLHVPGHSPGSVAFYDEAGGQLVGGDVLFQGSIGRTDLWQGSMDTLLASIRDRVLTLPDETVVYSGHGPATTVGAERRANPFLRDL
ncbi:MBL fold metallo-hydrolase [Rubrivirga sp. S365]|uniref:MBL fold metallo-hydrolase n=1 Tax=Rubrivirga litoralis TaxID=3075598 RepID=A0ABU3BPC3_9BACT|nr:MULTISPECIES: MBL fold metallo-hydrolase [unclassified Rubrivirga]MDT0631134.1 MBL fold metallo-hydrolase [Rubrivirga sp. F394]MDT7855353.1 MBL fold metallo-hydrolase [Rubrivirga sp. S365]